MDMHRLNHIQVLKGVNLSFYRYLYRQIKWDDRLIGIQGARGVGKTTLLLQRIKSVFGDSETALYLPLDNIRFERNTVSKVVKNFCAAGGTHLFLDNVHRYERWTSLIGKLHATYPDLYIVFAISSQYPESKIIRALKEDVELYTLQTMSFREYLDYEGALELKPYSLEDIVRNHATISQKIMDEINIAPIFRNYLDHGCYPFYWDDPDSYFFRLQDLMRDSVDIDLPAIASVDYKMQHKIKELLLLLAEKLPEVPRFSQLAQEMKLDSTQIRKCIEYIMSMGIFRILQSDENPEGEFLQKSYLNNTNLLACLFREDDRTYMAETFFIDQISNVATVKLMENNDLLVDDKYTFLVGDPLKDYWRVRKTENIYGAIHGLSKSSGHKMPLWLLGLCY
ncbi:AAA family ATPase [Parabacteroides sp. AM08-6]|uniref:ATP-binding protein n=1 Tax=Parabacteroides sp. AM08-6 TaxID=2292053 RepID=UPI000EFE0BAC|nr:AAA family ATPase [Parabacteroides sp. AM08-6]RHJ82579.1 AAA family ATPase [Parabacteroides sp. AM08-6]